MITMLNNFKKKNADDILRHFDQAEMTEYIQNIKDAKNNAPGSKIEINILKTFAIGLILTSGAFHILSFLEKK